MITKKKLLRDGQIVGYQKSDGTASYDNQVWVTMDIPHDTEKAFLSFDSINLVEIYEA